MEFLDVGQGDAILITVGESRALIDAGPDGAQDALIDALSDRGVTELSLFFVTHGDADHAGGADAVLRRFAVGAVYVPDPASGASALRAMKNAAHDCGTDVRAVCAGDYFYLGQAEIRVLSPALPLCGEENTDSLVLLFSYGESRALLMGDADRAAEARILKACGEQIPRCELLKVGHHGSQTSTSDAWLEAVRPAYAVISCGRANTFGHPHAETLTALKNHGAEIFRTDRLGDVRFVSDGKAFRPASGK